MDYNNRFMKYIPTEKLVAEIYKHIGKYDSILHEQSIPVVKGKREEAFSILTIIESLQQEQPEVDLVAELKQHLATTPKEQLEKEWKELEPWNNIGPTVQEFLYGKQPEVDFFDEILDVFDANCKLPPRSEEELTMLETIARHFWNKGYNARKEK